MRLLITTGPTRESIDAVRYISNRSSGKVGMGIASAGVAAGCTVTLLAGPGVDTSSAPAGCVVMRFESAADLQSLLVREFPECDVLVMAAAVADYRPRQRVTGKIERNSSGSLTLELEPIPDLVAALASGKRSDQRIVAFALEEPARLKERASAKLARKRVDAIVANPLETMDSGDIDPHWLTAGGVARSPGAMSKEAFGAWLLDCIRTDLSLPGRG